MPPASASATCRSRSTSYCSSRPGNDRLCVIVEVEDARGLSQPAFAGGHPSPVDVAAGAERHHQHRPAILGGEMRAALPPLDREPGSIDQNGSAAVACHSRQRPGKGAADGGKPVVEVERARPAVIVKAISDIDVLLHLDQRQAGTDRVNCTGGRIEHITGRDRMPCDQCLDSCRRVRQRATRPALRPAGARGRSLRPARRRE